jgi:hypothetical protein
MVRFSNFFVLTSKIARVLQRDIHIVWS